MRARQPPRDRTRTEDTTQTTSSDAPTSQQTAHKRAPSRLGSCPATPAHCTRCAALFWPRQHGWMDAVVCVCAGAQEQGWLCIIRRCDMPEAPGARRMHGIDQHGRSHAMLTTTELPSSWSCWTLLHAGVVEQSKCKLATPLTPWPLLQWRSGLKRDSDHLVLAVT